MRSVENYHITKMCIIRHFEKRGIITSFAPKVSEEMVEGNGCKAQISLWKVETTG